MAATAAQVAQLARMVNDEKREAFSDAALRSYIEAYPMLDELGTAPYYWNSAVNPPVQVAEVGWIPTYDLHAAAAAIWEEKAAMLSPDPSLRADDNTARLQASEQAMKQARYHRSRKSAKTFTSHQSPAENSQQANWLVNQIKGKRP